MTYCTKCGTEAPDDSAKFCHKCGASLIIGEVKNSVQQNTDITEARFGLQDEDIVSQTFDTELRAARSYKRGEDLEIEVERILRAEGYTTERRKRILPDMKTSEMDIIASKNRKGYKEEIVVECKNYGYPVPVKEIQAFDSKMKVLGKKNGLFAVYPQFSTEALRWGQELSLKLWDWAIIQEKLNLIKIDRLDSGEFAPLKYFLPLKVDFESAVKLNLENGNNIDLEKVKLIWKPFYVFDYKLKCVRYNPRKQKQVIDRSGYYIVDGNSGKLLTKTDSLKKVFSKMMGQSMEESLKVKEDEIFMQELMQNPESGLRLRKNDEYEISIIKPAEKEEKLRKIVLATIIV